MSSQSINKLSKLQVNDDLANNRGANYGSQDVVASAQTGVELTKFKFLPTNLAHQKHVMIKAGNQQDESKIDTSPIKIQFNMSKSQSIGDFKPHQDDNNELNSLGLPWTSVSLTNQINQLTESKSELSSSCSELKDQFQVVWRKLSFEVDLNTYDQLLGRSLNKLTSFWRRDSAEEKPDSANGGHELNKLPAPEKINNQRRLIFENLNGYFKSGEITAILGPSGAGKTSLLNAICGRTENYHGSVQLIGGGNRRMRMSIIPQKDYLEENLTVRENLLYSSKILNLDKNFDHEANIMRVVKMLNLKNCFNSKACSISGGEYKRVSIAQELLRQPDIMILDEPTSGLDSLNCKNLIKSLNELIQASRMGKIQPIAIVMTIHQPDIDTFQMFDHVYCMARGGRVIFDGHPSDVMETMRTQAGFLDSEMPPELAVTSTRTTNPANVLIEIASELVYGQSPVDQLSNYQLRQFELNLTLLRDESCRSSPLPLGSQPTSNRTSSCSLDLYGQANLLNTLQSANDSKDIKSKNKHKSSLISFSNGSNYTPELSLSNGHLAGNNQKRLTHDKRLLAKIDHRGQFWHHTWILTKRTFISNMRDPFMTMVSLLFHLTIPFVMAVVYDGRIGRVKGCPAVQRNMDIVSLISNNTARRLSEMQNEITTSYECGTMYFLTTYSFSMCAISVSALAFPLSMHILLKEYRNGWYRLPSYVVAKTIASLPSEVILPSVSIVMVYYMLEMPSSYMQWRLGAIVIIVALLAMISTTHGLVFGAMFMNSVQTAIFLSIASTLPLTLLSGYTARITRMPTILQYTSWLSLYRYSTDAINIIRFGYGLCPCDESTENYLRDTTPKLLGIPSRLQPMMTYYIVNTAAQPNETEIETTTLSSLLTNDTLGSPHQLTNTTSAITSYANNRVTGISNDLILDSAARNELMTKLEANEIDLFGRLASILSKTFTYGQDLEKCSTLRSQILTSIDTPPDDILPYLFAGLVCLLIVSKIILFLVVKRRVENII